MDDPFITSQVGRILTLMGTLPNSRNRPSPPDLQGDFDLWFDGGAAKIDTGVTKWEFADGARATTTTCLRFAVRAFTAIM